MILSPEVAFESFELLLVNQRLGLNNLLHRLVYLAPHYSVQLIDYIHLTLRRFPSLEGEP